MIDIFQEPEDYYQKDKPSSKISHTLPTGEVLELSLVGESPLWGHHLFPSAIVLASYLHTHASRLCVGRRVLELGAGAGLPGLSAWRYGASRVTISDYPDEELVVNLKKNIERNKELLDSGRKNESQVRVGNDESSSLVAAGYIWGRELSQDGSAFDTMILSDLMFNHSQHSALVSTIRMYLTRSATARALVFFTPHRPWLVERDLGFFQVLEQEGQGLKAEKVVDHKMDKVMFEDDQGDEEMRKAVWGWEVYWGGEALGLQASDRGHHENGT